MKKFSFFAPHLIKKSEQAIPAAPAPTQTTLQSSIFLPCNSTAFKIPAVVTIAVPCWSSWKIGTLQRLINSRSISKHSGALISSKLTPPKVLAIHSTVVIKSSTLLLSTSISIALISAKRLKSNALHYRLRC